MRPRPSSYVCTALCLFFSFFSANAFTQEVPVQPRIAQAVDETNLTTLRGNTHPLARTLYDRGVAPASMPLDRMLLVLKRSPEQDADLVQLLDEQQDKSSSNYHKWLTPEEFGKRFGPADSDIQAVTAWLQTHGFKVNQVSKGKSVIEFSGTAAMVQESFHAAMHKYVVAGESHWANANDPQIPAALTRKPQLQQQAAASPTVLGPTRSIHRPATAADSPSETMATVKIHVTCASDQSPAALVATPRTFISGGLKTLQA